MTVAAKPEKPLGRKVYGSLPHLPGSRLGPGDHHAHEGQVRIATEKVRDRHDVVYVQEKLDGSCTAVAKVNGEIVPLNRAGYRAIQSPYRQHHLFHDWVMENRVRFENLLLEGERVVGEWLAQAHGTRYDLRNRHPWVAFDIIGPQVDDKHVPRLPVDFVDDRVSRAGLTYVTTMSSFGAQPPSISDAMLWLGDRGFYSADRPEGAVWRIERKGIPDFIVKYVRPDKVDGIYLPDVEQSVNPGTEVWNWQP